MNKLIKDFSDFSLWKIDEKKTSEMPQNLC